MFWQLTNTECPAVRSAVNLSNARADEVRSGIRWAFGPGERAAGSVMHLVALVCPVVSLATAGSLAT